MSKVKEELIGYAAVDSGQLLITDPAYVYGQAISIPRSAESQQIKFVSTGKPAAVLASTEIGDGVYPVHALRRKKTGELVALIISIEDDDDDDESE